jgi:hypothetical protein
MKVLVCGGRDYEEQSFVSDVLDDVHQTHNIEILIHGSAAGADRCARRWAESRRVAHWAFPAQWATLGRAAGPIRNQIMLEEARPDLVISFPGGSGTADMMRRATLAGVPVKEYRRPA